LAVILFLVVSLGAAYFSSTATPNGNTQPNTPVRVPTQSTKTAQATASPQITNTPQPTAAHVVKISDQSQVLNTAQVQSEAEKLPYPINIYTMNNFTGSESAFNQEAVRTLNDTNNPRLIIIAIDTRNKYLAIVGGKDVSTSNSVYNDAVNAFKSNYNGGDYTGATIAALRSLESSLGVASAGQTAQ
jgi:hypothetical protein